MGLIPEYLEKTVILLKVFIVTTIHLTRKVLIGREPENYHDVESLGRN